MFGERLSPSSGATSLHSRLSVLSSPVGLVTWPWTWRKSQFIAFLEQRSDVIHLELEKGLCSAYVSAIQSVEFIHLLSRLLMVWMEESKGYCGARVNKHDRRKRCCYARDFIWLHNTRASQQPQSRNSVSNTPQGTSSFSKLVKQALARIP